MPSDHAIVMAPPVLVHVDSRQKKRTMIKNAYAAATKTTMKPIEESFDGPLKPNV